MFSFLWTFFFKKTIYIIFSASTVASYGTMRRLRVRFDFCSLCFYLIRIPIVWKHAYILPIWEMRPPVFFFSNALISATLNPLSIFSLTQVSGRLQIWFWRAGLRPTWIYSPASPLFYIWNIHRFKKMDRCCDMLCAQSRYPWFAFDYDRRFLLQLLVVWEAYRSFFSILSRTK